MNTSELIDEMKHADLLIKRLLFLGRRAAPGV